LTKFLDIVISESRTLKMKKEDVLNTLLVLGAILGVIGFILSLAYNPSTTTVVEEDEESSPSLEEISKPFSRVPLGEGVELAANYTANSTEIHPLVILNERGSMSNWTSMIPSSWQPSAVEEVELVLLLKGEEKVQIEAVGPYLDSNNNSIWIRRYQYRINLTIYKAKTAEIVGEAVVWGSAPRNCTAEEPAWLRSLEGGHIEWPQIEESLIQSGLNLTLQPE